MTSTADQVPDIVVVGVDGSPHGAEALRAALRQAELTDSLVHAVLAWEWPSIFSVPEPAPGLEGKSFEEQAEHRLAEAVAEAVGPGPQPRIRRRVVQGSPTQVLLDAAQDARLLVVGSRGYGGFKGIMLGSVSQHLAQYAPCSVLIVRSAADR
ncbi:universal stress protein [Streptacidiphilus jiangxiensis]|uniref:Nucleotide-binding universal stress protein, UspA family n=1 Tax=Streptacidiphilus jiangxiensis TaxID=235985 RepID=A0A1H7YAP9_STRJI|nr:universal stress protein [Streptacidiphilus jiangxiensis]SEM42269.1 Nucleotide-binding universal stress protein, UspA family [Streptacidiphilus jiangxiensis]